jgi:predicted  nucleic acid-binding Zn-ribbon protein
VQILAFRANQQEQRINNLTDQLNVLNGKLVESSAQIARMNSQIEHAKDSVRVETDPDRRQGFQQELQALTYMLEEKGSAQSAVQMQAEAIRQQIIREQSNLSDTQRLLDELAR